MKIYITTHSKYDENHISLCTTDFKLAINHFVDYAKTGWYNSMGSIEIWEDNEKLLDYGSMRFDIINLKEDATFEEIKDDILRQMGKLA